ncbi:hypothetical protein VHA_000020 [Grimontia hollisae CIP 101886]|uniref:Uncharacterized protein n=1 Tax=Grimontia hollisae CIP 101886 TaxID=675812 RepID=D0I2Q7_GRIHO|nr:hypothetical protein VHA_000020 [Grimontia hollisae CIP 101886]
MGRSSGRVGDAVVLLRDTGLPEAHGECRCRRQGKATKKGT